MEKGEVGVLAVQFGALIIVVLVLSSFASGTNSQSTPEIAKVYWGAIPPSGSTTLTQATNTEATNASSVSVFYTLAFSTHVVSYTASRLCIAPNGTGDELIYTNIPLSNTSSQAPYFTFAPTSQQPGWKCLYTITLTDSLDQTTNWVGTVVVKPPSG